MSTSYELRCRECGKLWGNQPRSICEDCFSPLEVTYDYDSLRARISREQIAQRPPNMWRYAELLPLPKDFHPSLPAGFTPLISAPHLGKQLGAKRLCIKNDARSEEHTSELQSHSDLVCRLLLEKKKNRGIVTTSGITL